MPYQDSETILKIAKNVLVLCCLIITCIGCSSEHSVPITQNNLSDSYIDPYWISVNGKVGIPAELIGCSNEAGASSIATSHMKEAPKFLVIEWLHVVSKQFYRAKLSLDEHTAYWLNKSPFNYANNESVALVIQWRGENQVAAMLVADFTEYSHGNMDIGVATGELIPAPANLPNYSATYETMRKQAGDSFLPGNINYYDRTFDGELARSQRFGCPRMQNGSVNKSRLPSAKLPFVHGENGEHIHCEDYSCSNKRTLIKQLKSHGWKTYPPGSTPPAITFNDAAEPKPAW